MKLVSILSQSVVEKYPEFERLSVKQQKIVIKKTVQHAIKKSLLQVQLPKPKNRIRQAIEKWRYEHRRSDAYRERVKLTDYDFIESLRRLRESNPKNTITDFENKFGDTSSNSFEKNPIKSSTSGTIHIPYFDYSSFSGNTEKSRFKLFKSDIDSDVFSSITKLRNHIIRSKYALKASLLEMVTAQKNSGKFTTNNTEKNKTFISKSLFQLYELNLFLTSIKKLENYIRLNYQKKFQKELTSCYEILYQYYDQWLSYYGKTFKNLSQIESELLLNNEFMMIDEENPLMEGFTMLSSNSIDFEKIKNYLDEKTLKTIFLPKNR